MFFVSRFFEGWELLLIDGDSEDIEPWVEAKENQAWENELNDRTERMESVRAMSKESDEED